jgi:hypothetical protein
MMKFIVELSSKGDSDKPCPEAVEVTGVGYPYKANWQIELNTLEDLIEFIKRQNEGVIVFPPSKTSFRRHDNESWLIEIYNDYRE